MAVYAYEIIFLSEAIMLCIFEYVLILKKKYLGLEFDMENSNSVFVIFAVYVIRHCITFIFHFNKK